jgi:hypothetical protein
VIVSPVQSNPAPHADGIAVVVQNFSSRKGRLDTRPVRYVNLPFAMTVTAQ